MLAMQAAPLQGIVFKKGTNQPLSKAVVELRRDQQNASALNTLTTEDDGRFVFDNVPPGRYRLTVTRRGYTRPPLTISVVAGQATAEIQLPMTQAGTISGRIYDANGQPLGNVEVLAMKASYPEGRRILTPVQGAISNDLGEYRLFWLAAGRYYVSAVHPKAQSTFRRMSNMVGIGMTSIGGMFQSAARSDPALGGFEPEPELESERYAPIFLGGTTNEQSASAVDIRAGTEVAGDYRVNIAPLLNVTPVRIPIPLPTALQNAYVKSIRLGNTDVLNGALHLEGKPSTPLEVVIGKNSGAIDGQVLTDRQVSVADVSVVLVPNVRRRSELYRTTTTDVSGRFHFDRVPPGDYKVFSWEDVQEGAWYDPEFLRAHENQGMPVRIVEARTEGVRIEVIP